MGKNYQRIKTTGDCPYEPSSSAHPRRSTPSDSDARPHNMRTSSLEVRQEFLSLVENRAELSLVEKRTKRVLRLQNASASHSETLAGARDTDSLPISIPSEPGCEAIYITANNTDRGHSERHARMAVGCFR